MNLTRTFAIFLRQLYLFRSNPSRLSAIFLWMVVDVIQWGFITRYLWSLGQGKLGYLTVILGAIILWGFMTRMQQGVMTSFLEDIWSQNFINFFASPLTIVEYLSGLVLTSMATAIFGFIVVVTIAGLGFGYNFFVIGLHLLPFMAILFTFAIAMGITMSAVIFRLGPSAEWLGWPIPVVMSVFAGVYYPISTLPAPCQMISRIIPASYVFEELRAVLISQPSAFSPAGGLLIGGLLALFYLALAYAFFIKIYHRNLENGAIAKFSAET